MRLSLRYKFILAFIVFMIGLSAIFGGFAAQRLNSLLKDFYEWHAVHMVESLAEEIIEHHLLDIEHDLDGIMKKLMNEDLVYIQIVLDQQVISQTNRTSIDLPILPEPDRIQVTEITQDLGAAHLDLIHPLYDSFEALGQFDHQFDLDEELHIYEGIRGYVRIGVSLERMEREVQSEWLMIIGLSLALLVMGIIAIWITYRLLLGPIEELNVAVRDFGAGKTSARARVHSGDEIEALSHEFNLMADSIIEQRDILHHKNDELEKANRVKSVFLATISHELRTPLHSILGYASLFLDEVNLKLNEAGRQYARSIQRGGKHLMALIENLIEFSKLEAGAEKVRLDHVNVQEIVDEVIENQNLLAAEKGLRMEAQVEPNMTFHSDGTKLKQVLLNLLNNAIKYTEKGSVQLAARFQNQMAFFEVADTGPGIAPETQEILFDPFKRANQTARKTDDGLGLGLAVVKRYIELMHGSLSYESTLGQGSRFWFTLPLEDVDEIADR